MRRLAFVATILLVAAPAKAEDQPFKNERAKTAREAYQAALKEARDAYIAELERAIREEGGQGNVEEAQLLDEAKQALVDEQAGLETDPVRRFQNSLENTRWVTGPGVFNRFLPNNRTINHKGEKGVWMASDEKTAVMQVYNSRSVYVFKFNDNVTEATFFKFEEVPGHRVNAKKQ